MLTRRVIPCLDVRDGRVVKGVRFGNLRDSGDPVELAAAYEAQGADELVVLDVSATPEGRGTAVETLRAVRGAISIPITIGGGIRRREDAERMLASGADKVGVNTAAVDRPEILSELAERVGVQCVVLAVDAARREGGRDGWEVVTRSGTNRTGLDAIEWMRRGQELGAGEMLLTSWDRDGTREGYDLELLGAASRAVERPIIASGGADSPGHMAEALTHGADAVLAASIFHEGEWTVAGIKEELARAGVPVRRLEVTQ
ncbi:MAG: imidazole glycerol phosphate synthase subunit HisF [Phycisphaerales bacterium JB040]